MNKFTSGKQIRDCRMVSRDFAAKAVWATFPGRSENEVCNLAARVLDTSPNTIRRILRKETDAKFSLMLPILALGAASSVINFMEPGD